MEEIPRDTPGALLRNAVSPILLMAQRPVFYEKTSTSRTETKSASEDLDSECEEVWEITNSVCLYVLLYVCPKAIQDLKFYF